MVFDQLKHLGKYLMPEQTEKIKYFLEKLSSDMEEGYYEIDGELIYAKVMSYSTSLRYDCRIEAHERYIDIQSSLIGCEGIEIWDRNRLNKLQEYEENQDVVFYEETIAPYATVENIPGYFTIIFPEEAHRPQISSNQKCEMVKKFVIKVRI